MEKPLVLLIPVLLLIGTAFALDAPPMKEGLWKLHQSTNIPGMPSMEMNYSVCRDHAYDARVKQMAKSQPGCTMSADSVSGSQRSFTSSCKVGATTIVSKGVMTWSGENHVHSETHATYAPAFSGMTQETMIQDQTYVGACPAGMSPGDRMGADGQIMHHR